jgi:hypothetical protein
MLQAHERTKATWTLMAEVMTKSTGKKNKQSTHFFGPMKALTLHLE